MSETIAFSTVAAGMKPEVARKRIASFARRFGKPHMYLAYHAAFPLALTPDLLYRLWANFQLNIHGQTLNIPWVAVADLLLSSLCDEVGYELYEMDITVRNELLSQLQQDQNFERKRINELSEFLLDYIRQQLHSNDLDIRDFAKAQQWTALAYTRPSRAAHELALAFSLNQQDTAELVRITALVETLAEPLAEKFQPLLIYARGMAIFASGDLKSATDLLNQIVGPENRIRIAGVRLPIPTKIEPNLQPPSAIGKDYRRANLRGHSFKGQDLRGADFSYSDIRGANFTNASLVGANFSHATAGLQRRLAIGLILCSLLLLALSAITKVSIGYLLAFSLFNGTTYSFISVVSFIMFAAICVRIFRRGLEATLGAVALALTGIMNAFVALALAVGGMASGTGVGAVAWVALAVAIAVATAVILAAVWAVVEDGTWGLAAPLAGSLAAGAALILLLTGFYAIAVVLSGFGGVGFSAVAIAWALCVAVVWAVGLAVAWAVGVAVAWVVGVAVAWAMAWAVACAVAAVVLVALSGIVTEAAAGAVATVGVGAVIGLGTYVGWRSLVGDRKYAVVQKIAITLVAMGGTSFRSANLTDANFTQAILKNTDLRQANLTRTSWLQAKKLNLASVGESYLKYPQVRQVAITGMGQGENFDGLPLQGLNLCEAKLADASFIQTDLSEANLQDADLSRAKLVQTQLDRTDLTGACLTGACIQDWNITSSTKLDGVECQYVYLRLPTKENPDPNRQPEEYQDIFEPGEFADFFQP